jgi:hypothetical protein
MNPNGLLPLLESAKTASQLIPQCVSVFHPPLEHMAKSIRQAPTFSVPMTLDLFQGGLMVTFLFVYCTNSLMNTILTTATGFMTSGAEADINKVVISDMGVTSLTMEPLRSLTKIATSYAVTSPSSPNVLLMMLVLLLILMTLIRSLINWVSHGIILKTSLLNPPQLILASSGIYQPLLFHLAPQKRKNTYAQSLTGKAARLMSLMTLKIYTGNYFMPAQSSQPVELFSPA